MLNLSSRITERKEPRHALGLLVMILSIFIICSPRVSAAPIIENGGWIPPDQQIPQVYPGGDCSPHEHAQANWISPRNQSNIESVNVPYGTPVVALQWQYASGVCNNGLDASGAAKASIQNLTATFVENTGVSVNSATNAAIPGISVSVGTPKNIAFSYDYSRRYQPTTLAPVPIDVTLPTNLAPGTYALTLDVSSRSGHSYSTNPPGTLECVQSAGATKLVVNKLSECPPGTRSKTITLTVEQPTNVIGNFDRADCSLIQGWAYDDDAGTSPIEVHLYIDGVGWNTGPTNVDRPDLPGGTGGRVKGIKHGFSVLATGSPVNLFDGATHVVNAFGINVGPGVNKQLSNNWPIDSSYGRTIKCVQTSGTFKITPSPQLPTLKPDEESPNKADFYASFKSDVSKVSNVTTTCRYYTLRNGATLSELGTYSQVQTIDSSGTAHCKKDDVGLSGLTAGDQVCIDATASPGEGSVDGNGTITGTTLAQVMVPQCNRVANKPYVSFYGSDVKVGGDMEGTQGGACASMPQSKIDAFTNPTTNTGASVQFAAFAIGTINQFTTASLRAASPTPPDGLKLASFGTYGASCTHNYYADKAGGSNWAPGSSGKFSIPSDLSLGAMNIATGQHLFLYVAGDIKITGNITMDQQGPTGQWTSRQQIPSLYLIATGNIYIDHNVSNIAGVFIAQHGAIDTCSNDSVPSGTDPAFAVADLYNQCGKQLTIDGAFIAKQVILHRAFGSLRNSGSDNAFAANTPKACATSQLTQPSTNTCAAEVFRFSPALYLAEAPEAVTNSTTSNNQYQYISNLPPIL